MNKATVLLILRLIEALAMGARLAPEIKARFDEINARLRRMVEEGRDPSVAEWIELNTETSALFRQIQDS